ncbi:hypothetical protein IGB31_00100 [Pseudomonas putida]|nr:hypothetical protein IGB31_00100 [Pseudomonas putida]
MNTIKQYLATGLGLLGIAAIIFFTGLFVFRFGLLDTKHAGLFMVGAIATVVALVFMFKFITDIEHFNTTMMIVSMAAGTILLISSLGFGGIIYSIFFNGFCKVLEKAGFYKAIYRGFGNVLGSALSTVYKPKVNKYSKYL